MSMIMNLARSVEITLFRRTFVVIKPTVLVVSYPEYTIELPPTVSLTPFGSDFLGSNQPQFAPM